MLACPLSMACMAPAWFSAMACSSKLPDSTKAAIYDRLAALMLWSTTTMGILPTLVCTAKANRIISTAQPITTRGIDLASRSIWITSF